MGTIKINDDNLTVLYNNKKMNINEILRDFWSGNDYQLKMQLTTFHEYYDNLCRETKLNNVTCCNIAFGMCNLNIPSIKFNIDMDMKNIENIYNSFKKNHIFNYNFKTRKDLLSIILFHYITHDYKLKYCSVCNNFFIVKDAKNKYCSEKCKSKNNSIMELKRRKNNPIAQIKKRITEMLEARGDIESYNLLNEYKKELEEKERELNQKQLLKWLENKHKSLKRR